MGGFLLDILEFVALILFLRVLGRNLQSLFSGSRMHVRVGRGAPARSPDPGPETGQMARDLVCGMFVSTELPHRLQQGSQTLYFCSEECLEKYQKVSAHAAY